MRKLFVLFSIGLLALGMTGIASAATLNWKGTFIIDMVDFGQGIASGGGVATVNGSSGGVPAHISTLRLAPSRGHVTGTDINIITDPDTIGGAGLAAINYEQMEGGTGTLGGISGGAASTGPLTNGLMPIRGVVKICLLSTVCTEYLSLPFTKPTTVNGVPGGGIQGIGIGGLMTVGGYGGIRMSMQHAPWTIKTITATDQITTVNGSLVTINVVQKGWAHAPASTTSSTAQGSGMVQLVTPNQTETNLPVGSNDVVGSTGLFVMHFIPEPGLVLLLGSGVVGLAVLGRKRMRR